MFIGNKKCRIYAACGVSQTPNSIENPEDIKKFDRLGYAFRHDLSSDTEYIFERRIEITSY